MSHIKRADIWSGDALATWSHLVVAWLHCPTAADDLHIIVYNGGGFLSSLVKEGVIDEFHLFINPNALGQGMPIFNRLTKPLKLKTATVFSNGVALLFYELKRD